MISRHRYDTPYRNAVAVFVKMGRPQLHNEQTAEALLRAAEAIVAAGGPDALSVRRVAQQAGTTTRAVYTLFESKDGLIVALGTRAFQILGSLVADAPRTEDPEADLVNVMVRVFRGWALEHPALFRIGYAQDRIPAELEDRFRPTRLRAGADFAEFVGRGLGLEGGLANPVVHEATFKFNAMCEGFALLELRGALPPGRAEHIWREGLTELVNGATGATPANRGSAKRAASTRTQGPDGRR